MKRKLSDSLKASIAEERKAVKNKPSSLDTRIAKAENVFDNGKAKITQKQEKVIRDTFTIPQSDYHLLEKCRDRGLNHKYVINKSEIIRAGLLLLDSLSDNKFLEAIGNVKKIKTGRPKP
jgi:hypothetical protein